MVSSKQIISTQKQYDFLESLTAEIPLPPSHPSTPPPQSTPAHSRRRRKQSPSSQQDLATPVDPIPKRKRRSPQKEEVNHGAHPDVDSVKSDPEEGENAKGEKAQSQSRGWFDIVMGSNEQDSSDEDYGVKKRKYRSFELMCTDNVL
jgi:hypothetical protein